MLSGSPEAGVGYGMYYYHQSRALKEQVSSSSLVETLEELERAYSTSGDWKEVEVAAKTGLQAHKNSSLAPYFMVVEAQALAQQGSIAQAVELLDKAIAALPKDISLRYLFMTTQAQIKMDSQEKALLGQGVDQLIALTKDSKNIYKDKALYNLLQYYQSQGNTQEAEATQAQLQSFASNDKEPSPWAQLASTEQG